jgi:D-alanine--poly(phosphoribitol) ligase subunit 1
MTYEYNLGMRFYNVANNYKDKIALRYPNGFGISYDRLNKVSNQLARYLLKLGCKRGDVVAILNEKSYMAFSLMIACLKCGIIYTNIDVSSPQSRIEKMINKCLPKVIFLDADIEDKHDRYIEIFAGIQVVDLQDIEVLDKIGEFIHENLDETFAVTGSNGSYIMFTSGSTGFPKGALMSHSNVLNFIHWGRETFKITSHDIFTNANPIYFDNSVFDFYVSIFNGATLVPLSHSVVKDAKEVVKLINKSGCTIWFSVPSLLVYLLTTKALTKADFPNITRISFGGEGFPKNKLKQLFEMFRDRITLYNVYGPTECTCICSSYVINSSDFEKMGELAPLGKIASNFDFKIIPMSGEKDNVGELALIGPCVGLGYYNDEEKTKSSFVQNTYVKYPQLMYKTGDIVEESKNGYLNFRGRVDNQIKHMGYRIELEEVEAAFSSLEYVNEVGVIYEKLSPELGQIKAFVSVNDIYKNEEEVLDDIRKMLPPYMIPRRLIILPILPKNQNGKIDRRQLTTMQHG